MAVISMKTDLKKRVYHKDGCIYTNRIKAENRRMISTKKAQALHFHECKYCSGLKGDVRVHKQDIAEWERKNQIKIYYETKTDTLYLQTQVGFWKLFLKKEANAYLLYHRNYFNDQIALSQAMNGEFHRQSDVGETKSLGKIVDYIVSHDRAKVVIMDNYKKLPQSTKQQKKYFRAAERKAKRREHRRVNQLFTYIEQQNEDIRMYSFC